MTRTTDSWKEVSAYITNGFSANALARGALHEGIVIFGAGFYGRAVARYLKADGIPLLGFADNDPGKHRRPVQGLPVFPPQHPMVRSAPLVLIAARHEVAAARQQLEALGCNCLSFDTFFVHSNIERLERVRDFFLDADSKLSYDGVLKAMLTGEKRHCASIMSNRQYFALPAFTSAGNEHFIDAGAFVGDTIEKFIWETSGAFAAIHAFEPGAPQYAAMCSRIDRLKSEWALADAKVSCVQAGLADSTKWMNIDLVDSSLQNTTCTERAESSDAPNEPGTVKALALDDYLAGRPATFIKADIEGGEMNMLKGARHTIVQYRPKLALSVYHNPQDLFEICEYVNGLVPDYKMAFRHHSRSLMESTLYCWTADHE